MQQRESVSETDDILQSEKSQAARQTRQLEKAAFARMHDEGRGDAEEMQGKAEDIGAV